MFFDGPTGCFRFSAHPAIFPPNFVPSSLRCKLKLKLFDPPIYLQLPPSWLESFFLVRLKLVRIHSIGALSVDRMSVWLTVSALRWPHHAVQGIDAPTFPFAIYCRNSQDYEDALSLLTIIRAVEQMPSRREMADHLLSVNAIKHLFKSVRKFYCVLSGRNERPCLYLHW